jgi:Flp pilus assembly protein TadG
MTMISPDRGESSTQFAAIAPVLVVLVFSVVHASALWMGAQFATTVASEGARTGAVAGPAREFRDTADAVERTAAELGATLDRAPQVAISRTAVSVTVSLRVPRIIPFLSSSVTRTVTVAREQFLTEDER